MANCVSNSTACSCIVAYVLSAKEIIKDGGLVRQIVCM